ncbi:MAG: sulfotransferase [Pseudomonadota bacterium]
MTTQRNSQFQSLVDLAATALAAKDYRQCHEHCIAAIKLDPRQGEPYLLLSVLTSDHGNYPKAIEIIEMAIKHQGPQPRFLAQQAKCLALLSRHEEAAEVADEAAKSDNLDQFSAETLGVVFSRLGEHARAVPLFECASSHDRTNPEYQYNLGASLQFSGKFEEAEHAYIKTVELKSDHHKAHYGLASLRDQSDEDARLERLIALFEATAEPDAALHLGHAIAKTLEDKDAYPEALDYLLEAKAHKRSTLEYDFSSDKALFEAAKGLVDIDIDPLAEGGGPIFIVGMPRTGTSLIDRILSSHSGVMSMGELAHFGLLLKEQTKTPSPFVLDQETLEQARHIDLALIGDRYLQMTRRLRGGTPNFIDKMPLNFFYAPLILAALPAARVVCVQRNPMDTCVSNFRQLFSTSYSYYNYSYDLEDTGRFYVEFDRLIDRWSEALPAERFAAVQYEAVIADQEKETRRLLEFCGLEFEEGCLEFHANPAPIATASSVQVRSPIYGSSVDRWKKFGQKLAPLEAIMRAAGRL